MQPARRRVRPTVRDTRNAGPLVYERLSDPILVRRAKDGDACALDALCARHAARAERIALHVLRRPEDAADAAQESLVKLVERLDSYRGQSLFTTWFHRVVVNTCKDVAQARWQEERRTEPLIEDAREAADGDPVKAVVSVETRRELGRCLAELPPAQATVDALKDALDLGFDEIASVTGMPVGTAKCYAHRGRNELREKLSA